MGYIENIIIKDNKDNSIFKYSETRTFQNRDMHIPINFIDYKNRNEITTRKEFNLTEFISYIKMMEYELLVRYLNHLTLEEVYDINNFENDFMDYIKESYDDTRKYFYKYNGYFHIDLQFDNTYNIMLDLHKEVVTVYNNFKKDYIMLNKIDLDFEDLKEEYITNIKKVFSKYKLLIHFINNYIYKYTGVHEDSFMRYKKLLEEVIKYKNEKDYKIIIEILC